MGYTLCMKSDSHRTCDRHLRNLLRNETYYSHTDGCSGTALATLASLHGVFPLLYTGHSSLKREEESMRLRMLKGNMLLSGQLVRIVQAFESTHIRYLALKGPVLSQLLYGNVLVRQYSDIDLLVPETELVKAANLLVTLGFIPRLPLSLLHRRAFIALDNDFTFHHGTNGAVVELHWRLFPKRHTMPLEFQTLYKDARSVTLSGHAVKTLSVENTLLYLTLHGAKHIFERYEWVYDLHTLIRKYPQTDLWKIYSEAGRMGVSVPFLLGLSLAHTLFGTPLPEAFRKRISPHVMKLQERVLNYYEEGFVHFDESKKKRLRFLFLADLFNDRTPKAVMLLRSLFRTTPVDVITFNLPDALDFLYPLMRPFRLTCKHLFKRETTHA